MNLDFLYMFFGFLAILGSVPAVLAPNTLRKILKKLFRDEVHLRTIAIWYLTLGPATLYSGWMTGNYFAANFISVIGLLFSLAGITMFFYTELLQKKVLKKVLKLSESAYRVSGLAKFILGVVMFYFGALS